MVLILGLSFVIGLGLRPKIARRSGRWFERTVLDRLPADNALKSLTTGFAEAGKAGAFKAAVLTSSDGDREFVYVIEDHGDEDLTVLVPWAPAAFAGSVKIVDRDRIKFLEANLGDVSRALGHWGVGVRELLASREK